PGALLRRSGLAAGLGLLDLVLVLVLILRGDGLELVGLLGGHLLDGGVVDRRLGGLPRRRLARRLLSLCLGRDRRLRLALALDERGVGGAVEHALDPNLDLLADEAGRI